MENILRELKLESLFPKFVAQRIEPENVSALSDEELSCLGASTIGDRLRVRGLCAQRTSMSCTLGPAIQSCDTGQWFLTAVS